MHGFRTVICTRTNQAITFRRQDGCGHKRRVTAAGPGIRLTWRLLLCMTAVVLACAPASAEEAGWSDRKLDKVLLAIDRDMDHQRWRRVLEQGTEALPQCIRLRTEKAPACVILLNKINHSLYHTGRFVENREGIEKTYHLALEVLGKNHFTTGMSRELYYRLLLAEEQYLPAIEVLLDIIAHETSHGNDRFELLTRIRQLYALYGLTGQFTREEETLRKLLTMTDKLFGADSEEYRDIALALAENLCTQKKYYEFFEFVNDHKLDSSCQLQ